ncbi:MAG TPA: DUF6686 family protein [Pedobacter sp.]|uniref:DUF6686 family protein n=1 Tax=Pedobacter sp. TaxID=1411316 RepID=UPI002CB4D718|nr:DUF6686 family protein [Pedobacter sp.]HMI04345.1 DUF6686 family protein [Pedobacter sp.]
MCKTRLLSTKDQTVITSCVGCKMFYIWHNNLLLNFSCEAFMSFRNVVNNMPFHNNCLPFPDQEERVVLHTPNDDISFAFEYEEFEVFKAAIDEAIYMSEIYALMNEE